MSATPPPSLGVIETDASCDGCGFNLYSQAVWRDERLGLPVARCPECGRHHAVGRSTSAGTAWLSRLALLGLLIWLALGVGFVLASFGLCLGVQAGASEIFVRRSFETADGRGVYMTMNHTSPESPGPKWVREPSYDVHGDHDDHDIHGDQGEPREEAERLVSAADVLYRVRPAGMFVPPPGIRLRDVWSAEALLKFGAIIAGAAAGVMATGVVASCAAWFWRPRWRVAWLALPIVAALVMGLIEWANLGSTYETRVARDGGIPFVGVGWLVANVAAVACLQVACLAIGLRVGRPVARLLLTIFIPPGARQAFAFLWHCDGKVMPRAHVSSGSDR